MLHRRQGLLCFAIDVHLHGVDAQRIAGCRYTTLDIVRLLIYRVVAFIHRIVEDHSIALLHICEAGQAVGR